MNFFFDTSSFFKLYHKEEDTEAIFEILNNSRGYKVLLSELTLVEMYSSILKKVRTKQMLKSEADVFIEVVDNDFKDVLLIPINSMLIAEAQRLVLQYGMQGLRSLDAIQLAAAISEKTNISLAFTSDKLLKQFLMAEGIKCM